jgi:adenylate cyclase
VKLSLILIGFISTGMIVLGLIVLSNQTHVLKNQMISFCETEASRLGDSAKELILSGDQLGLMVLTDSSVQGKNVFGVAFFTDMGQALVQKGAIPKGDMAQLKGRAEAISPRGLVLEWKFPPESGEKGGAISFLSPIFFKDVVAGHILVTYSKKEIEQSLQETIRTIILVTLVMILFAVFGAIVTSKYLTRPIESLIDANKAIRHGRFSHRILQNRNDEIGFLITSFNEMASELEEKSQMRHALSQYVSCGVADHIMDNLDNIVLGGQHVEGTVLFADIVGFTSFSENLPPSDVAALLNEYFSYIAAISSLYKGTIDKYIGDCAMIVFGAPQADSDHKFHAIACAIMIQKLVKQLNEVRDAAGLPAINFRIGINSGKMLAGNLGSTERMQYSVIGDTVNRAARLQTVADEGQIIIDEELLSDSSLRRRVRSKSNKKVALRGIQDAVSTAIVYDVIGACREKMDVELTRILDGKSV